MIFIGLSRSFNIVYASELDILNLALEYLYSLLTTVYIEEVVGENEVALIGIHLHALGISLGADDDLIALNSCGKLGIDELEVLRCGEEYGTLGYNAAVYDKLVGAIIVQYRDPLYLSITVVGLMRA